MMRRRWMTAFGLTLMAAGCAASEAADVGGDAAHGGP
ncbi:uncharacterized protein SOCEGT47_078010 [Sorangium cellulosum]|uniref:Secreted protein n=1 Tax=Sorangium cellulosum TaxID=56 RepID=A0A4P2QCY0_SORCE|nr:uncharacterized protein SOCEGT47_078010 [Sorangium cellulosum]